MVQATKDDNLDSIIEKILTQTSIKSKFSVYSLFYITHKHYIPAVNILLQIDDPELWKCNGKGSGTSMVQADYSSSNLLPPMFLCVSNNVLYYIVDMHEYGKEIWRLK